MSKTVAHVARELDAALPFVRVDVTATSGTTLLADVVARAGTDPLHPWRDATRRQLEHRHGVAVRPHIPAAFVLQWWCEAVATPLAYAAQLGPWVLSGPDRLGFDLAPALHPDRLVLLPGLGVDVVADEPARRVRARAAYDEVVGPVVAAFAPEVRMGSRQRWGVVDDVWDLATRGARLSIRAPVGPESWRTSCCFVYALPGLRACARCPRLRPT